MKYTVVVADDERLIAKNIARSIESVNEAFEVVEICSCGADVLTYVRQHMPNVIFTDICMPEMDGLELAHILSEEFPFIPCVIVSGYNDFQYAKNAITYRVNDYLLKPINKEELKDCLAQIEKDFHTQCPNLKNLIDENKRTRDPEDIVALLKEYIHKNYKTSIDLSSIAANLGFSSAYLSKVFSRQTGLPPSKYLKEYRIMIAKQLMNDPDISISAVSYQTGFVDQFHFSKTFKSITGLNPTEYRNQCFIQTSPSKTPK
jgi:YesN/AraC family two-component response regulator